MRFLNINCTIKILSANPFTFIKSFYFKGTQLSIGCFPNHAMIGFVTLGHLLNTGDDAKKVAKGGKANHGWEDTL